MQRALLVALLAAAGLLRFAGVDHDLRRTGAEFDEDHNFVDPIRRMWSKGTPDPSVYSGYPGLFNHLAFLPVIAAQGLFGDVGAVTAGRAVVGAFGVLNVLLVHHLARTAFGPGPALLAAALMAFSRAEVRAAHYITPDVLVVSALLGVLILVSRPSPRPRDLAASGVLTGLATAVKYSGLLIAPAVVVAALHGPRRGRSLAIVFACSLAAFVLAAPYAAFALGRPGMGAGLFDVVGVYFGVADGRLTGNEAAQGRGLALLDVLREVLASVGAGAVALALVSPFGRRRQPVASAAAVCFANVVVLGAANLLYSRHVLALSAAVVVLAAAGLAALRDRWPTVVRSPAVALAVVAAVVAPAASLSVPLAVSYARPSPADGAADWIERECSAGATVATSFPRLDLDPERFEVRTFGAWTLVPPAGLPHYDLLVLRSPADGRDVPGARVLAAFGEGRWETSVARVPRPPLARIRAAAFETLPPGGAPAAAFDGDPATAWTAPPGPAGLVVRWPEPREVHRIEVEVGPREGSWPRTVTFEGWTDAESGWTALRVFGVRPNHPTRQRRTGAPGQVFALVPPARLRGVRLLRPDGAEWSLAELRILARRPDTPPAAEPPC